MNRQSDAVDLSLHILDEDLIQSESGSDAQLRLSDGQLLWNSASPFNHMQTWNHCFGNKRKPDDTECSVTKDTISQGQHDGQIFDIFIEEVELDLSWDSGCCNSTQEVDKRLA